MSKIKNKGRPGKTKTELLLRHQLDRVAQINTKLAEAKRALDNEASEVLEEVMRIAEVQQEQINEINRRLNRLEGEEDVGDNKIVEECEEALEREGESVSGEEQA
jgi:hypothetical protein